MNYSDLDYIKVKYITYDAVIQYKPRKNVWIFIMILYREQKIMDN